MQLNQKCVVTFVLILLSPTGNSYSAEKNLKSQVQENFETCKSWYNLEGVSYISLLNLIQ